MQAAELCLRALKIATDSSQRSDLRSKCQALLDEAERIKLVDEWHPLNTVHILGPQDSATASSRMLLASSKSSNTHLEDSTTEPLIGDAISTLNLNDATISSTPRLFPTKPVNSVEETQRKAASIRQLREPCSTRELTKSEQIILLRGSKLNGFQFPPWTAAPGSDAFKLAEEEQLFM
jgi:calpain-7